MSTAMDVSSSVQSSTDPEIHSQSSERPGSAAELAAGPSLRPREDGTARQIMQLLQEIQNPQARPAPFLGENPCIPFFYRPDEHDEVKILVVWKPLCASDGANLNLFTWCFLLGCLATWTRGFFPLCFSGFYREIWFILKLFGSIWFVCKPVIP